jgi:hypothetical protein
MLLTAVCASVVVVFSATGAAAPTQTRGAYSCTILFGHEYGIIFSGTNRRLLRRGCRIFASGAGKPIHWGFHEPLGWTWVAQYAQPKLAMIAQSVAPPRLKRIVFVLTNRAIFTSRGWVLIRRH